MKARLCQDLHIWHIVTDYGVDELINIGLSSKFSVELFKFELQFRVRFISRYPGLLHNLNTLIPFRILMIIYS